MKVPLGGKGGMILLSTDVNATVGKGIRRWIAAKLRTSWQRRRRDPLVDEIILEQLAKASLAVGWSIADKLRRAFRQQEVILKSYDTEEAEHIRQELTR